METIQSSKHLQCMEVWGGNRAVSMAVELPGLDAWIYSRPVGGANGGGDVHYASSCAAGALSRLLIADVSGHGAEAAQSARRLRRLMQRHIVQHEQTKFVRSLNREFAALARDGRFATAVAFTYDAPINRLQICNAGHPPPLFYRTSEQSWSFLEQPRHGGSAPNFPLGIDRVADYEEFEWPVRIGDVLVCYTDALPESRLAGNGMLGSAGLLSLLQQVAVSDISRVIPRLMERIAAAGAVIEDDLTVLVMRPNGQRSFVPIHQRLLAPLRYFRAKAVNYLEDADEAEPMLQA